MRTSIEVTVEVEIERARSTVWDYLADAERSPEWIGEFTEARLISEGPAGVGSVISTVEGDRSGTLEIVEWDPPRRGRLGWTASALRRRRDAAARLANHRRGR